ncbi:structural maintenance of chromosomes protein 6 isoform X2 [Cylas formicarius]|uniref:structural maintenance of chromosomes protein 6 isoform X2 n=1 Tax=Cylas formicarius TaxID=197179 RepID=UPI002958BB42|nr:structural maintenance of chromosomes protein 6 isoform X2 [Cylas formicarius]
MTNPLYRAGVINRIALKNFMCHSFLEVDFATNISMIIGKNGSGKSAILTGLIVGLGGKANLTNRGTSVKSFVKVGKPSGSVEIELCNEGPMAYKPRVYGSRIVIVRNVNASGGGSYKVKAATGEVVSTQAKEVQNITANLNIQIDNPICVLNQDTSRNFLSGGSSKNKFALFVRATRLDTLESEYRKILDNKNESVAKLDEKKGNFQKLKDEIKNLKKKIENHQSIVSLKDKKFELQRELMWAQVRDVEDDYCEAEENAKQIKKKLDDFVENCNKRENESDTIAHCISDIERQMTELKEQADIQRRQQSDLRRQLDELMDAYNAKKRDRRAAAVVAESKTQDVAYLENEIANATENMSKVAEQKHERLRKLEALRDQLKGLSDQLETTQNELFQAKSHLARKHEDENSLKAEVDQIEAQIAQERRSLQALERESGNALTLYGNGISTVVQEIERRKNEFAHVPRGPLGFHIKLREKKWAVAIEGYLGGGNIKAFVVDNRKDGQLLQQIFARACQGEQYPTVITSKFIYRRHDVSRNKVAAPGDCVSLYDVLDIEDPIVSNCIVDQCSPENILLIPTNDRAMELLAEQARVPTNCKQGLTTNGDKYYPDPNYKTYASNYHRCRYLQVDTREHMRLLQENINSLSDKKQSVLHQLRALQNEINQQTLTARHLEEKIRKVQMARSKIRREHDELNQSAEPEVHNLQYLETEAAELRKTIEENKASMEQATEEMKEMRAQIQEREEKIGAMRKVCKEIEERMWPLQRELEERRAKRDQAVVNGQFAKRRIEEFRGKVAEAEASSALKKRVVEAKTAEAAELGARPPDLRAVVQVSHEISELTRNIYRIQTESDNIGHVTDRYRQLSEKFQNSAEIMDRLIGNVRELTVGVERRKKHYKLTENYFVTFMKHSFRRILEVRQFEGTIDIDMEARKLELVVIPQQGSQGPTTTANLSGGERSFSTVAFLYALWQCMDFPFYFLDEFDVYMDKLNRTKVIEILLHHARSKPDLQFVFLTPQDVSFVPQDVSILRLQDPERMDV